MAPQHRRRPLEQRPVAAGGDASVGSRRGCRHSSKPPGRQRAIHCSRCKSAALPAEPPARPTRPRCAGTAPPRPPARNRTPRPSSPPSRCPPPCRRRRRSRRPRGAAGTSSSSRTDSAPRLRRADAQLTREMRHHDRRPLLGAPAGKRPGGERHGGRDHARASSAPAAPPTERRPPRRSRDPRHVAS